MENQQFNLSRNILKEDRMEQNLPSRITKLIKKSESGDFATSYQLYKIFDSNEYGVEPDEKMSNYFKELSAKQLEGGQLRIADIRLENYKGFDRFRNDGFNWRNACFRNKLWRNQTWSFHR